MSHESGMWGQFEGLHNTVDSSAVSAIRCGRGMQHLLVKGQFGEPVLLLSSQLRINPRAPISLKHVKVSFDHNYEATNVETGTITTGSYCRFSCDPQSPGLHRYFVELLVAIAHTHLGKLDQDAVDEVVDALLELFRKLTAVQKKTVSGLWGELLLMRAAFNPASLVEAWHISNTDAFDFAFFDARLEVKSTERSVREHEFSLAQVRGGREGDTIVSVRLVRSAAGATVLDLTREIAKKVSPQLQQKLWKLVVEILGDGIESAQEQAFDVATAIDELIFLPTTTIPSPSVSLQDALLISDVRFHANISGVGMEARIDRDIFLKRLN